MIGRIVMTRVEPCFKGNKPASGEVSKVKKDGKSQNNASLTSNGVDTFTSSQSAKKTEKTEKVEQAENNAK